MGTITIFVSLARERFWGGGAQTEKLNSVLVGYDLPTLTLEASYSGQPPTLNCVFTANDLNDTDHLRKENHVYCLVSVLCLLCQRQNRTL